MTRPVAGILLMVLALSACSKPPEKTSTPVPTSTPRPRLLPPAPAGGEASARLPAPELDATGVSPGRWTANSDTEARFADGLFAVRCDPRTHQLLFVRASAIPVATIRIVTDTGGATYGASMQRGEAIADTSSSDAFVTDILIPATSRIGITTDQGTIVVPPDAIMVDTIRACRRASGLVRAR